MTLSKFNKLYKAYKQTFDLEQALIRSESSYSEIEQKPTIDDAIPF